MVFDELKGILKEVIYGESETPAVKPQPQKPKKKTETHSHAAKQNSTVEKKKEYVGSLGAVNDEGCIEHADERYIEADNLRKVETANYNELAKILVLGEVLGKPKCRR